MQSDGGTPPPPPNPILDAYESFCNDTPWVTRSVVTSQAVSWLLSFFFDPTYPLANIPYFTLYGFELYRIVLSPFICTHFLTLVFVYIGFVDNGRRLEQSYGSATFAFLLLVVLGVGVNLAFLALALTLSFLSGSSRCLYWSSHGVWMLLFGMLEMECSKAPSGSKRALVGSVMVPTMYYPLVILGIFSVLGGFQISYLLAIGVGYLHGKGHLDRYLPDASTMKRYEDNQLSHLKQQKGWVSAQESLGSTATWSSASEVADEANHSLALTQETSSPFPSGPGRTLGFASKRTNAPSIQEARLKALERSNVMTGPADSPPSLQDQPTDGSTVV